MLLEQKSESTCNKPRRRRKKRQGYRLLHALKHALTHEAKVTILGEDLLFKALHKDGSGEAPVSAACQILFDGTPITVVGVPDRLWCKTVPRGQLFRTRKRMEELGRRCIVVPQSALASHSTSSDGQTSTFRLVFDQIKAQTLFWHEPPSF